MFNRSRFVLVVAIFLSTLVWQSPAFAMVLMIDDFITVQDVEVDAVAPPSQSAGSSLNTASAIGVERDLYVEKTAGTAGERIRARVNPNGESLLR
ncbi:MAG: hypothetical protein KJ749_05505, partial [Planctomycetes bacterium]|nr:hypothetical protein [Planctomycetota bacterium]